MLKFVKTPKYARWIKLGMIGFSILAISLSIVFLVNIITPFGRLTISSPANSFVELIFCIFVSISLILRLNDIMNYKQQVPYKIGLEIIIAAIGILQLIDFICWFINPVSDVLAAIICLFTFFIAGFHFGLWILQRIENNKKVQELDDHLTQQIQYIENQGSIQIPQTSKCKLVLEYILYSFMLVLVILNTCQIIHEANYPNSLGEGEQFYTVESQGYDVKIRTYCTGVKNQQQIILEAGGGSGGCDFSEIQTQLSKNYRVCSYDRAGYGMSWQAAAPQNSKNAMIIVQQVMEKVGFNTSVPNSIICVGHSAGGQLCRYYAQQMASIKGIVLLDSVPVMNWFYLAGQCQNQTVSQIYAQQQSTLPLIKTMASLWPLYIITPFMSKGGFKPSNLQGWVNWQITTTRNWYSQSLGYASELEECQEQCMESSIINPESMIDKPIIVITASNQSITCEDRNLTGTDCQNYYCQQNASMKLAVNQSLLGNEVSKYVECPGICNHDFIWKQPDFIVQQIEYYIPLF
ncbi:unnamed protein product (macronuclear) [Paramecium tetraurelia]|uniref:AB hydrolase-1 domain-containing protein n=1 Tax=Paramecium tetraurelia TaxID=5888 RepID=A0CJ40_PARTE|nr:uncharacterized protein GSPATT00038589001 [Paramecium tetraurelia]CAK70807.1 unnamed protein product [Paramecium tetraurelia]|eukprot:XP_001438204.1 hypothetical protein (macronuclear) [Paramecium tetraurelia strain d4-2]